MVEETDAKKHKLTADKEPAKPAPAKTAKKVKINRILLFFFLNNYFIWLITFRIHPKLKKLLQVFLKRHND